MGIAGFVIGLIGIFFLSFILSPLSLIFGIIAIFLIFRLKNLLGTKTDFEETSVKQDNKKEKFSNIIPLKSSKKSEEINRYNDEIKKIKEVDASFEIEEFLIGSRTFFEMVLKSFVNGNLDNIKDFIKPSVLNNFKTAIDERNKEQETLIIDLKSIQKNEILSSKITKTTLSITVGYESFQVKALLDKNDELIDGDIDKEILVKDAWVFERKIKNDNPNWTLVETKSN